MSKARLSCLSAAIAAMFMAALPAQANQQQQQQQQQQQDQQSSTVAYRASVLHFIGDPSATQQSHEYYEDGVLLVGADGKVKAAGPASTILANNPYVQVVDLRGRLIVPGFIDSHVHYPQTEMIGSFGEQLLEWLNTYTFPTESQFGN